MQAFSVKKETPVYAGDMRTGRPTKRERQPFGKRLAELRMKAGLSQAELAGRVGGNQRLVAHWERRAVSLKPEQITALARALDITADELLGIRPARQAGPSGRVRQVFDAVAALPRRQQQKILDVIEAFAEKRSSRK